MLRELLKSQNSENKKIYLISSYKDLSRNVDLLFGFEFVKVTIHFSHVFCNRNQLSLLFFPSHFVTSSDVNARHPALKKVNAYRFN